MVSTTLFDERSSKSGRRRWWRVDEIPLSRIAVYELIKSGLVQSIVVRWPGSTKGRRLIDGDSLDRYFESLATAQFEPTPVKRGKSTGRRRKVSAEQSTEVTTTEALQNEKARSADVAH